MDWETNQLICKHQNRLQGQFPIAVVEQVFQAWPKEINNHDIVIALNSKPFEMGDTGYICIQRILGKEPTSNGHNSKRALLTSLGINEL